jgi:hypothetical protein
VKSVFNVSLKKVSVRPFLQIRTLAKSMSQVRKRSVLEAAKEISAAVTVKIVDSKRKRLVGKTSAATVAAPAPALAAPPSTAQAANQRRAGVQIAAYTKAKANALKRGKTMPQAMAIAKEAGRVAVAALA